MSLLAARLAGGKSATRIPAAITSRSYSIKVAGSSNIFLTGAKSPKTVSTSKGTTTTTKTSTTNSSDASNSTTSASAGKADNVAGEQPIKAPSDDRPNPVSVSANTDTTNETTTSANLKQPISIGAGSSSIHRPQSYAAAEGRPQLPHPQPTKETLLLHSFFAVHRPLLLLPAHGRQILFESFKDLGASQEKRATSNAEPISSEPQVDLATGAIIPPQADESAQLEEDMHERDANASRLLGSTYTLNRIGSLVDWQHILKRLGDVEAATQIDGIKSAAADATMEAESWNVAMDSVKRKRKKKMNKHIFKKRRKKERSLRRRLGK